MNDHQIPQKMPEAPITRKDERGVVWGFEPAENRWFAIVNGKKSSSKDFTKLSDKVSDLLVKAQGGIQKEPVSKGESIEVILFSRTLPGMGVRNNFAPILAKVGWNAKSSSYELLRFKNLQDDGSPVDGMSWHSAFVDKMDVFHPDCLSELQKSQIANDVVFKHFLNVLKNFEMKVWDAWRSKKENIKTVYGVDNNRSLSVFNEIPVFQSSHYTSVSSQLSYVKVPSRDLNGWSSTDSGDYRRGSVSIRMTTPSMSSFSPSFEVFCDRWPNPLFCGSFNLAVSIGNATHEIIENNIPSVTEWHGKETFSSKKVEQHEAVLPKLVESWGAVILPSEQLYSGRISSYLLCDGVDSSDAGKTDKVSWKPILESTYTGAFLVCNPGPEDVLLHEIKKMRRRVFEFLVGHGVAELSKMHSALDGDVSVSRLKPALVALPENKEVLAEIVGRLTDDSELAQKPAAVLIEQFKKNVEGVKKSVLAQKDYVELLELIQSFDPEAVVVTPSKSKMKP